MNLAEFTPPKGTTVTRLMTLKERKQAGRKAHARRIVERLRDFELWTQVKVVHAKSHGYRMSITLCEQNAVIACDQSSPRSFASMTVPYYSEREGQFSLEYWLSNLNPTVAARFLKNATQQLNDNLSIAGNLRNNMITKEGVSFAELM